MCECVYVSYALLMSSATVIVRSSGLFWLNPVAMVFLCCVVLLRPCCMEMCGMLFVMYVRSVFYRDFAMIEINEMGLYDVPMFMSLFGMDIMCVSFYV